MKHFLKNSHTRTLPPWIRYFILKCMEGIHQIYDHAGTGTLVLLSVNDVAPPPPPLPNALQVITTREYFAPYSSTIEKLQ